MWRLCATPPFLVGYFSSNNHPALGVNSAWFRVISRYQHQRTSPSSDCMWVVSIIVVPHVSCKQRTFVRIIPTKTAKCFTLLTTMVTSLKWKTKFTKSFPCRIPVMGAPMADVSGADLAAETCRAGGLGFLAAGHLNNKEALHSLENQIEKFKDLSDGKYPLCIGFISHSTFGSKTGWDLFENVLESHEPDVVQFFAGTVHSSGRHQNSDAVKIAHSYGCKVIMQVCTVEDAEAAFELGVNAICAQGSEAGGHGIRRELGSGTLSLTAKIVELSSKRPKPIPILAAGGITCGKDVAAALALGADGVVLGTRLWASTEAMGPKRYKDALVAAKSGDDVIRTRAFDTIAGSFRPIKWPVPYDSSGVLRNNTTKQWDDDVKLEKVLGSLEGENVIKQFKKATTDQDTTYCAVYSGKGVGKIYSIEPAYEIISRIEQETIDAIRNAEKILPDTSNGV